jgi:hypothetical protein
MGIVIYAVLFNDLPWEKALLTDPDYREVEESGGVASSVANFGSLSGAMRTLLAEMLCSDYTRRCPVSELVDFLAERRAWFTSEEVCDTSHFPFTLPACGSTRLTLELCNLRHQSHQRTLFLLGIITRAVEKRVWFHSINKAVS